MELRKSNRVAFFGSEVICNFVGTYKVLSSVARLYFWFVGKPMEWGFCRLNGRPDAQPTKH